MKKPNYFKLSKRTALALMNKVLPVTAKQLQGGEAAPGVYRYTAQVGCFEIRCENDRYSHAGRFAVVVHDCEGGAAIKMFFHPETLNRDFGAEQAEKDAESREARVIWAQTMGREMAHKLIDQYLGE